MYVGVCMFIYLVHRLDFRVQNKIDEISMKMVAFRKAV